MALLSMESLLANWNTLLPLLFLAGAVVVFWQFSGPRMDSREPPLLSPAIPVIGHIIGMMKHQMDYYAILSRKSPSSNFTMPLLKSKVYVVTSPFLVQAALRHKDLDFTTFITGIGLRPFGILKQTIDRISLDSMDRKKTSYMSELHKLIYETLGPGPSLDRMNSKMLSKVAVTLNTIGDVFVVQQLWPWLQKIFTLATTYSLYGECDPFSTIPGLYGALWDFDDQIGILLLGIMQPVIARRGYKGREAIQKALARYYEVGHDKNSDTSDLVKGRGSLHRRYGFSIDEMGKIELSMPWVSTTNAIPALYWMLCYVVSDTRLLEDLRGEVKNAFTATGEGANQTLTFNIAKFNSDDCPLLLSTYQESIRLTNFQVSIRMVEADTFLSGGDESILVKKGNVVQIPAGITHTSTATWSPNPDIFDARRFMKQLDEKKEQGKEKRSAYIPFGGGKHLCPGRNFAQAEILGMISAVITGFDVMGKDGGPVTTPKTRYLSKNMGQAMGKPRGPAEKLGVRFVRREGMENVKFSFSV